MRRTLILAGLALFVSGLEMGLFPLGEQMAHDFAARGSVPWLVAFAFSLGFGTTFAEPALIAVSRQAADLHAAAAPPHEQDAVRASYAWALRLTVAFVLLQIANTLFTRRFVVPRSLSVGPAVIVISVIVGFEIYGIGGAIYAAILAIFGTAILDAAGLAGAARALAAAAMVTPMVEPEPGAAPEPEPEPTSSA